MEELLNKLIEKGWKPFWNEKIKDAKTARWNINLLNEEVNKVSKFKDKVAFTNWVLIFDEINLRELVSKESWLWQFVCENGMVDYDSESWWWEFSYNSNYINWFYWDRIMENDYRYRVIESALKDESELEQFLLDNIKVWND